MFGPGGAIRSCVFKPGNFDSAVISGSEEIQIRRVAGVMFGREAKR